MNDLPMLFPPFPFHPSRFFDIDNPTRRSIPCYSARFPPLIYGQHSCRPLLFFMTSTSMEAFGLFNGDLQLIGDSSGYRDSFLCYKPFTNPVCDVPNNISSILPLET